MVKNKLKDYSLLVLIVIVLFLAVALFKYFCMKIGIDKKQEHLLWLWLVEIVVFVPIFYQRHKRLLPKINIILALNAIFMTTIYTVVLWYLDKIGCEVIPVFGIRHLAHFIGLGIIMFIINEDYLLKYLKKNQIPIEK
ncbi:MAG: hypothetical protein A2251_08755 [Elusimicrobia bacterium RIFOXYA2_FULL_47_53]|nr:MAG: hypothetical protein A2251_08755 [Elusimicrobia bacterium RIFOXYA2_FULL_47_53]